MTNPASNKVKVTPPYLSFSTFTSFLQTLKNNIIPPRMDSSVTPNLSGQTRGALNTGLEFFGLVDKDRNVAPKLKPLVEAFETDRWKNALGALLSDAYKPILGDLTILNATGKQLKDRFRENGGVDGQVLEKALRFYLAALDEAGTPYSPLFKQRGALTVRKKNGSKAGSPRKPKESPPLDDDLDQVEPTPLAADGLIPFVVSFPDKAAAKFYLPKNITEEDWTLIDTIGRAYVKRTAVKAG
jgi:hypothetical protein